MIVADTNILSTFARVGAIDHPYIHLLAEVPSLLALILPFGAIVGIDQNGRHLLNGQHGLVYYGCP